MSVDNVAVVTGASRRVGRAIANRAGGFRIQRIRHRLDR